MDDLLSVTRVAARFMEALGKPPAVYIPSQTTMGFTVFVPTPKDADELTRFLARSKLGRARTRIQDSHMLSAVELHWTPPTDRMPPLKDFQQVVEQWAKRRGLRLARDMRELRLGLETLSPDNNRKAAKTLNLADWGLEGLTQGQSVTLYHGTTRSFRTFDMSKSRGKLVNKFYGAGIFFAPVKRVAEAYALANRNIGFDPSIIEELRRKNPNAGAFLQALVDHGADGWESYWKEHGFWRDDPPPGEGTVDMTGFQEHLKGVDPNTLGDIAGYVIGSATKPLGSDDSGVINIFNQSTGSPGWVYDDLDAVGLDSSIYRPKVYTVDVKAKNPLVTSSKSQAKAAKSKGYDAVIYYGSDLVGGVPEVAIFNPSNAKIRTVEVVG